MRYMKVALTDLMHRFYSAKQRDIQRKFGKHFVLDQISLPVLDLLVEQAIQFD
ncbi:hypothetical protein PHSC3_000547 [Chlamydiales bacterium STE3]|nr:hypothetical protein PHSC3_000547 [Chlamydiales bacterium STE3]